jgi:hypothetical protein
LNNNGLPIFIKYDEKVGVFTISPTNKDEIKYYDIQVSLIDQFDAKTSYTFKIVISDLNSFNISK